VGVKVKSKTKIVSIISLFSASIMLVSFGGQKAEWEPNPKNPRLP